jgi:two-component system, OmpR family, phosphate regulon response regulator PhoB
MQVISVFTTTTFSGMAEEQVQGDIAYRFEHLDSAGPRQLLEGPVWAFIDWVMPDLSGLEMCRRLRADARMKDAHLTMVLERDELDDRRRALQAGADDYLVGPVDLARIMERVRALAGGPGEYMPGDIIERGGFTIDLKAHLARYRDRPIRVFPNQFRLLRYFVENANRVLPRQELVEALGKQEPPVNDRTVDKWVGRLRRSLQDVEGGHLLRTVHAHGYVLDIL